MGDHRLHVIDFTARSILGTDLPTVTKRLGHKLQWKIKPARRKYTRDLIKMRKAHKLDAKANKLRRPDNYANEEEYQLARKNFDKTHCELQRCCKDKCRKYKLDKLE